jgi:hypothetical protein
MRMGVVIDFVDHDSDEVRVMYPCINVIYTAMKRISGS